MLVSYFCLFHICGYTLLFLVLLIFVKIFWILIPSFNILVVRNFVEHASIYPAFIHLFTSLNQLNKFNKHLSVFYMLDRRERYKRQLKVFYYKKLII